FSSSASAVEVTDQKWALEFQTGFYWPTDSNIDAFLPKCCNMLYQLGFGRLIDSQYQIGLRAGIMSENAFAIGSVSGEPSGDRFNFTIVPVELNFIWRADFVENQVLVPYVDVGLDYLYFRENVSGAVTQGNKFGYHTGVGLQVLLEWFDRFADTHEQEGINDIYLTLEGRWMQVDNFGGNGLKVNGFVFSAGLLFEF
ncbi:MAG: hypothetical protein KDK66_05880, partial [Deltaproteobacteria bacterium]|nr:hypothetical protein [Deltaproteobacteria bacterium]